LTTPNLRGSYTEVRRSLLVSIAARWCAAFKQPYLQSTRRCPRSAPSSMRRCIPVSSDHLVRPTNADPHLIDLPLFGQPLPNGATAVSSMTFEPLATVGRSQQEIDWTLVASLRS